MNIGMEIEFTGVKRVKVAEGLGNLWGMGINNLNILCLMVLLV